MSTSNKAPDFERAANAFDHSLRIEKDAEKLAEEFPTAAAKLLEAAALLVKEARTAKAGS
jgi:HD superfamily phosphodiesterase